VYAEGTAPLRFALHPVWAWPIVALGLPRQLHRTRLRARNRSLHSIASILTLACSKPDWSLIDLSRALAGCRVVRGWNHSSDDGPRCWSESRGRAPRSTRAGRLRCWWSCTHRLGLAGRSKGWSLDWEGCRTEELGDHLFRLRLVNRLHLAGGGTSRRVEETVSRPQIRAAKRFIDVRQT
jgi:hypothetical protein